MPVTHPLILAHRGASASAPENTLEAFRLAVAQDADGIELDVRCTADGVLVVHHDPEVDELGPVVGVTFDRLREAAPTVPTLDEALSVTGDLLLDIEVKTGPDDPDPVVARRVARWLEAQGLEGRVVVTAFDPHAIAAVRSSAPTVATGLLVASTGSVGAAIERAAAGGHRWVLPHWSVLGGGPAVPIAEAHRRDVAVVTWTVDDPEMMRLLAGAGVDGIITNDPAAANRAFPG